VRLPGIGALVTNCGIDRSRARGLSRWGSHTLLNVSAGLGSSPYMPIRFCCRPEASLITLRPPGDPDGAIEQTDSAIRSGSTRADGRQTEPWPASATRRE
jgi:hypothetical protein